MSLEEMGVARVEVMERMVEKRVVEVHILFRGLESGDLSWQCLRMCFEDSEVIDNEIEGDNVY